MSIFRPVLPPKPRPAQMPFGIADAGAPVVLSAQVNAVKLGQRTAVADVTSLENPRKTAILVEEIRFTLKSDTVRELGYFIRVKLRIGRQQLMNDWVPLALLGTPIDRFQSAPINSTAGSNVDYLYTWRPPKPILVPENATLHVQFFYDNQFALGGGALPASIDCGVSMIGRDLGKGFRPPAIADLPWVANWLGSAVATGSDTVDQSQASHLVNPFPSPLVMYSMLGGIFVATADVDTELHLSTSYQNDQSAQAKVQIVDHKDRIIIRDQTPFGDAFAMLDNTWHMRQAPLEANGFYLAFVSMLGASAIASYQLQPAITMIGCRKVPFHGGGYEGEAF